MIRRGLHQHLMFPTHCSEQGNATRRGLVRANAMRALLVIAALWLLGLPSRPAHAGTVWAWGYNQFGQLGNNTTANYAFPVQVKGPGGIGVLSGITAIAAGARHSLAVDSTGAAWAWGTNIAGQLGDGTFTDRHVPVKVIGLAGVVAVAGGFNHSLALKGDGSVWSWGNNSAGQLGNGTITPSLRPVQVKGPDSIGVLTGITAIAAGVEFSLALRGADGAVFAWGYNFEGQLGNGTSGSNSNLPVRVWSPIGTCCLTAVKAIAAGGYHCLARMSDGSVLAWGNDDRGQLGDGTGSGTGGTGGTGGAGGAGGTVNVTGGGGNANGGHGGNANGGHGGNANGHGGISTIPVFALVPGAMTAIGAGGRHSIAVEFNGTAWAWGLAGQGQLGDNSFFDASAPVEVLGVGGSGVLTGIIGIRGGDFHSLARRSDGTLFAWGLGTQGQLGNGKTNSSSVPVQVSNLTGMAMIAAGSMHNLALKP
jgi:alpha-tubulin suppressor-like RCC1 family protein